MIHADILVIGAGASGLMAAKELSAKGKKVIILEARNRAGGRIDTLPPKHFSQPIEAGAEFIHGNLTLTLQLLKEYNIAYTKAAGTMLQKMNGKWQHTEEEIEGWDAMLQQMNVLKDDITLVNFLATYFSAEKYTLLRKSALQYAQGFDVADENNVSVMALRDEWQHDEEEQYRIPGGYMQLIDAMTMTCLRQHCEIHFSEVVNKITWSKNNVIVNTTSNTQFTAEKLVLTLPVSLLQDKAAITFTPAIEEKIAAYKNIGFGAVIKILMEFEKPFWEAIQKDALFIFSKEQIPTWWTQYPAKSNLLTGWLGGPKAYAMQDHSAEQILGIGLHSLQNIFDKELPTVTAWYVANWQKEPYSCGAYSYNTIQSAQAKKVLREPVEDTIYFAGEAVYNGAAKGTVEAALVSGKEVAENILKR